MKLAFRVLALLLVVLSAYYFIYWVTVPSGDLRWIANVVALICATWIGWYVWTRSGSERVPEELTSQPKPRVGRKTELVLFIVLVLAALFFNVRASGWLSLMPCLFQEGYVPADKSQLRGSGSIYLIPLNNYRPDGVQALAKFYHDKYGLAIKVGNPIPIPETVFNTRRRQYESESLLKFLRLELASVLKDSDSVAIALTDEDIFIASTAWRYAFSYRDPPLAVVSSANMDYGLFATWPSGRERRDIRFRKMVTKNIGVLYYHLPFSSHCRSVMYGSVGGPQELDVMKEDF